MHVPASDAKARLTDLVRQVETGEESVLTRHGKPAAQIVPMTSPAPTGAIRARLVAGLQCSAARNVRPRPEAALRQDFLYDDTGLPR